MNIKGRDFFFVCLVDFQVVSLQIGKKKGIKETKQTERKEYYRFEFYIGNESLRIEKLQVGLFLVEEGALLCNCVFSVVISLVHHHSWTTLCLLPAFFILLQTP